MNSRRWLTLVAATVAVPAIAADSPEAVLGRWANTQAGLKSLVVEFDYEYRVGSVEPARGTFRFLRRPAGDIAASVELVPTDKASGRTMYGLLTGGQVYLLDPAKKTACRFPSADDDPLGFVARNFAPPALLVDPKRAAAECRLDVTAQDEWYTSLALRPRTKSDASGFPDRYTDGRVVFMNRDGQSLPKGAVAQVSFADRDRGLSVRMDVRSWRANAADGPTADDFVPPEKRDGWTVEDWPFSGPKKKR